MFNISNIIKTSTGLKVDVQINYNDINLFRKELRNFIKKHYFYYELIQYVYISSDLFGGFIKNDFSEATNAVIYNIFNSKDESLFFLQKTDKKISIEFFFTPEIMFPLNPSLFPDPLLDPGFCDNPEIYIRDNYCYFDSCIFYNKTYFIYGFEEFQNDQYMFDFDITIKIILSRFFYYFNYKYNKKFVYFKIEKPFILTGIFDGEDICQDFQYKSVKQNLQKFYENISDNFRVNSLLNHSFTFSDSPFSNVIPIHITPTDDKNLTREISLRPLTLQLPYYVHYFNQYYFKLHDKKIIKTKDFLQQQKSTLEYYFGKKFYIAELNLGFYPLQKFHKYIFEIQILTNKNNELEIHYFINQNTTPSFIYILAHNEIKEIINFNYFSEHRISTVYHEHAKHLTDNIDIIDYQHPEYLAAVNQYAEITF